MNIKKIITSFLVFFIISAYLAIEVVVPMTKTVMAKNTTLAVRSISLEKRHKDTYVNNVFRDNILLNLAYMDGRVRSKSDVNWQNIQNPSSYEFVLNPGEVFAYHDYVLPAYQDKRIITTNAHFNATEGFLSDGYLFGDGVCHLASLTKWAAKDAGLAVLAPTRHDFAPIPEIPREEGVSIYSVPGQVAASAQQNLYIENTLDKSVTFAFNYKNNILNLTISKNLK